MKEEVSIFNKINLFAANHSKELPRYCKTLLIGGHLAIALITTFREPSENLVLCMCSI